jgi:DNA-binding PadR family transcriptional regulator
MERLGWLRSSSDPDGGKRARRDYRLTKEGHKVLTTIREQVKELYREAVLEARTRNKRTRS